jgi:hypothetical protein
MLFATWWIFVTILTSFYTANLTAFLTFANYDTPIKTFDDIAATREVNWAARKGGAIEEQIRRV